MSELLKLAERCEAATGPDRELDAAIAKAIGFGAWYASGNSKWAWTASLDAAMTLVPEGCDWILDSFDGRGGGPNASVYVKNDWIDAGKKGCTPALALCAAALRAKAAQSNE